MSALEKIAEALDLLAADLEAAPRAPTPELQKVASEEDRLRALCRDRLGEEVPDETLRKLGAADPSIREFVTKLAGHKAEAPTPLGEPGERHDTRVAVSAGEMLKQAADDFEAAILGDDDA